MTRCSTRPNPAPSENAMYPPEGPPPGGAGRPALPALPVVSTVGPGDGSTEPAEVPPGRTRDSKGNPDPESDPVPARV